MKWVLRLYPANWRQRYGDERDVLLDEHGLTLHGIVDLLRGAVDAWRHPVTGGPDAGPPGRWHVNLSIGRMAGLILLLGTTVSGLFYWAGVQRHGWMGPGQVRSDTVVFALMWGLILIGLAGLWLQARQMDHGNLVGELSLVLGIAGYLIFVRDAGILPAVGPWPNGDDLGLLGLSLLLVSVILQGVAAMGARILPLWSTLPLIVAPFLGARLLTLGVGLPPGPLGVPTALLFFSISWLLLGCGLLFAPRRDG